MNAPTRIYVWCITAESFSTKGLYGINGWSGTGVNHLLHKTAPGVLRIWREAINRVQLAAADPYAKVATMRK